MTKEEDIGTKQKRDSERIASLTLMDDVFMSKVFEDKQCVEVLLQAILDKKDLTVVRVEVQRSIASLQGRSVRLDILAHDDTGKKYNIEVQNSNSGATPKRARYNSSMLDANITDSGDKYEDLAETYVIFITAQDYFRAGKAVYHIERIVTETKRQFGDKSHIIYVNSSIQEDTELGRIMHDFHCTQVNDFQTETLAQRVKYFKETESGKRRLSGMLEEMRAESREEGREEGRAEGREEAKRKIAKNLISAKIPMDTIQETSGLSKEVLISLEKELQEEQAKQAKCAAN